MFIDVDDIPDSELCRKLSAELEKSGADAYSIEGIYSRLSELLDLLSDREKYFADAVNREYLCVIKFVRQSIENFIYRSQCQSQSIELCSSFIDTCAKVVSGDAEGLKVCNERVLSYFCDISEILYDVTGERTMFEECDKCASYLDDC